MLELKDAREYALTVFKTCKEVVSVNLASRDLDALRVELDLIGVEA